MRHAASLPKGESETKWGRAWDMMNQPGHDPDYSLPGAEYVSHERMQG